MDTPTINGYVPLRETAQVLSAKSTLCTKGNIMKPKLAKQYRSYALHDSTITKRTFTVGHRPSYEEVKPLACGEDEPFYYTIYERFVDLNDMRPLTTWGESSYA